MKQTIPAVSIAGLLAAFGLTCFFIAKFADRLPKDGGREFAHDGKLSAGKPRGAGLIFILVFVGVAFVFAPMSLELLIYLILVTVEMLTGYLDDAAEHPWGELRKGLLDLAVAVILAVTYLSFNPNTIWLAVPGMALTIPPVLFGALIVALVWGSVNVTNCADGVDGLSGTLVIITLATFYIIDHLLGSGDDFNVLILMFAVCILGYLWYNATPSLLMMGDAGSRAMGVFISIAALKSESPVLYIPVAVVLILDGGLGLLKLTLIRVCHVHILKNIRTPLHDHVRKNMGWSNTQTLFRFAIIQIAVSMITLSLIIL
ncbi:MAG: phospho-N-acetylmuramoyl-pentapeptide-transferase [Lachnospiraceae bacterium]|nr:phospho-N-acetylmuramoyl-pentapeptide-transferase [Lachnospiraceae bacterium]MDE7007541.1 phospho-N-acetylmuramoyl-pentapeptide-transferase [Lachnospiraceae bacterium]